MEPTVVGILLRVETRGWTGPPPQIVLSYAGALKSPVRTTDISVVVPVRDCEDEYRHPQYEDR